MTKFDFTSIMDRRHHDAIAVDCRRLIAVCADYIEVFRRRVVRRLRIITYLHGCKRTCCCATNCGLQEILAGCGECHILMAVCAILEGKVNTVFISGVVLTSSRCTSIAGPILLACRITICLFDKRSIVVAIIAKISQTEIVHAQPTSCCTCANTSKANGKFRCPVVIKIKVIGMYLISYFNIFLVATS